MARRITPISALTALLLAAALSPAAAQAQDAAAKYLKWDPATKTVTFELVAGAHGAKSPFNFDGYTDGEANLIVPPGSNVVMNFYQNGRHAAQRGDHRRQGPDAQHRRRPGDSAGLHQQGHGGAAPGGRAT